MSEGATITAPPIAPEAEPTPAFEFDEGFQTKVLGLLCRDTVFGQRTDGLLKPEYFTNEYDSVLASIVLDFFQKYKKTPDKAIFRTVLDDAIAAKKLRPEVVKGLGESVRNAFKADVSDRDFVVDKVAEFAKERAMESAMMEAVHALGKRDYAKIEKLFKSALTVGANDDASEYDYLERLRARTERRVAIATGTIKRDSITTGYSEIDKHLYHHGWGRKELSVLMARAKWGKSMGLGDFAKNASLAGHPTLVCSCEVSAEIYADRTDANVSETAMRLLTTNPFDVRDKVEAAFAKAAPLKIHDFASGTLKPSQLRRLIERYRMRGIIFDLIVVDYADIMAAEHPTGERRIDNDTIYIDLRALAHEQNAAVLTATQTNRTGAAKATAEATDVGENWGKVQHADLLISGNSTPEEIAAGEARLHFAASRNQKEITLRIKQDREKMGFLRKVIGIE